VSRPSLVAFGVNSNRIGNARSFDSVERRRRTQIRFSAQNMQEKQQKLSDNKKRVSKFSVFSIGFVPEAIGIVRNTVSMNYGVRTRFHVVIVIFNAFSIKFKFFLHA